MYDLIIRNARVLDPANGIDAVADVAVEGGRIARVGPAIAGAKARETVDAAGLWLMPGIIDMHTHVRTRPGHPHAQRMLAMAGVTTTLDMAGPLDDILETIPTSGAGIQVAVLEAARQGVTLSSARPDGAERRQLIESVLERGGIGIKLLGGHFPMDLDICQAFIEDAAQADAWVAWHVGNTVHGSDIEGMADAVAAAGSRFLHVAHINSYCRGKVRDETAEAMQAIDLLKAHPNLFSESYLSPLNGTRITVENGVPVSSVTSNCLRKLGYEATENGMLAALAEGNVGVLYDNGTTGELLYGKAALDYWQECRRNGKELTGSFAVNPAVSRFVLAQAKRGDGTFVVDSFSTDGGSYPRNVIIENGLLLVAFGAITPLEFVLKASLNGARALGLPAKGHLSAGADADITLIDPVARKAVSTIVRGNFVMREGVLCGHGTTIICDERGQKALTARGIEHIVKNPIDREGLTRRLKVR